MDVFEEQVADIRDRVADQTPMSSFAQLQATARKRRGRHRLGVAAAMAAVAVATISVPVALHEVAGRGVPVATSPDDPVKGPLAGPPLALSAVTRVASLCALDTQVSYAIVKA